MLFFYCFIFPFILLFLFVPTSLLVGVFFVFSSRLQVIFRCASVFLHCIYLMLFFVIFFCSVFPVFVFFLLKCFNLHLFLWGFLRVFSRLQVLFRCFFVFFFVCQVLLNADSSLFSVRFLMCFFFYCFIFSFFLLFLFVPRPSCGGFLRVFSRLQVIFRCFFVFFLYVRFC